MPEGSVLPGGRGAFDGRVAGRAATALRIPGLAPGILAYAVCFGVYLLTAEIGNRLTMTPEGVALVWPPNAIVLAALVRYRGEGVLGFAAAAVAAEILADLHKFPPGVAFAFAGANVVEVCVAWLLLQAWHFDPRFERVEDLGRFVLAGPLLGALVGAVVGTLFLGTVLPRESSFFDAVLLWWFGDALGLLVFTPFYLSLWVPGRAAAPPFRAHPLVDALAVLGCLATLAALSVLQRDYFPDVHLRPVLVLPFLLYAAVRLSFQGASVVVMLVSLHVVVLTVLGRSPYGAADPAQQAVWIQEFVLVACVSTLGLAALLGRARRDADVIQQANRELVQRAAALQQSNAELRRIAFVAAHDLQTPLRSLTSFAQLLRGELEGRVGPVAEDWIRRVTESARRLEALLRDLGVLASVDATEPHFEAVRLDALLEEVLGDLEGTVADAGAVVTRDVLPVVHGDRDQLFRLLKELVCNAVKFAGPTPPTVHVSARATAAEWELTVTDDGIGIPAEDRERVFELFYRLPAASGRPGTGFGLALCARVVHRHGGRIWITGVAGGGCAVHFTIPYAEAGA